jgi:hypothetical protein
MSGDGREKGEHDRAIATAHDTGEVSLPKDHIRHWMGKNL